MDRRYFLVILDSTGRSLRRFSLGRRTLQIAAASAVFALLLVLGITIHGLARRQAAHEADAMQRENEMLRQIAVQLESRLPQGRLLALHAELTFAQLWMKTGLGLTPRMLGVGPLEGEAWPDLGVGAGTALRKDGGQVLGVELPALPLEFDRLEEDGKTLQTSLAEMVEYFNDAELLLSNTPSVRPVNVGYLTSSYGKRRDPMHGNWVMHKGLDIGGRIGMEIFAPADGVVIFTGHRGGYGNTVVVDHGYGLQTHYAHLSQFKVKRGDRVRRGDLIAAMGNTGRSTGPHLHYEVRRGGQPLNPSSFILD